MGKINVLIFPAEGENAIELHNALSYCVNVCVFGASSIGRGGKYVFARYTDKLPFIIDENFLEEFVKYIRQNEIDCIFPTHDTVAQFLGEIADKIPAKLIMGDKYTVDICRSKIKTHELFAEYDFAPVRYKSMEEIKYPAFSKPDIGEGGHDAGIIEKESSENVDFSNYLITEYLPGEELTVDCLTDRNGNLVYMSSRYRDEVLGGICVLGRSIPNTEEIKEIARTINSKLHFLGLWYFQLRADKNGIYKLMEISTRVAGTMCLTRAKGINLPLLSVYTAMGYDIEAKDNGNEVSMRRTLVGKYDLHIEYSTVYIDFDDTITHNGEINPIAMAYLYQCKNKGIKVILLTRHEKQLHDSLKKYRIADSLFDRIEWIKGSESKAEVIKLIQNGDKQCIFIDNAYQERIIVSKECLIPTYDADAFEFLYDWKV